MAFEAIFEPPAPREGVVAKKRDFLAVYLGKGDFWASFVPSGPDYHVFSLHNLEGAGWEECQLIQSYFCKGEYDLDSRGNPVVTKEAIFSRPHAPIATANEFKPTEITFTDANQNERNVHIRHIPDLPTEPLIEESKKMAFEPWTYN